MPRTKGAKAKKTKETKVAEVVEAKLITPTIAEIPLFGNEDMHKLVNKVNEIIKFINK